MKRIYISKGIDYLEELVEDSRDDKNILQNIENELTFRKTQRAENLLDEVKEILVYLDDDSKEANKPIKTIEQEPIEKENTKEVQEVKKVEEVKIESVEIDNKPSEFLTEKSEEPKEKVGKKRGPVGRYEFGEYSLAKTFWIGFPFYLIIFILLLLIVAGEARYGKPLTFGEKVGLNFVYYLFIGIFLRALWNAKENSKSKFWKTVTKIFVWVMAIGPILPYILGFFFFLFS